MKYLVLFIWHMCRCASKFWLIFQDPTYALNHYLSCNITYTQCCMYSMYANICMYIELWCKFWSHQLIYSDMKLTNLNVKVANTYKNHWSFDSSHRRSLTLYDFRIHSICYMFCRHSICNIKYLIHTYIRSYWNVTKLVCSFILLSLTLYGLI